MHLSQAAQYLLHVQGENRAVPGHIMLHIKVEHQMFWIFEYEDQRGPYRDSQHMTLLLT